MRRGRERAPEPLDAQGACEAALSIYDEVAAYHRAHGDDFGSEDSRIARYRTICELADFEGKTVLDVGCGLRRFRDWLRPYHVDYTGIDLLDGKNVLDEHGRFEIVVAGGLFYRLPSESYAWRLIEHMWSLCSEALIFTSLSIWAPRLDPDSLYLDPLETLRRCSALSRSLVLRHDYLPHDFAVALYRR